MKRDIIKTAHYPQPIERVWRALTDPASLAQWLMPNDFAPVVGHEFTFRTRPRGKHFDGVVHCKVLELDAPRLLAYSWRGGDLDTVVRFRLAPDGAGTRLDFEQTGFAGMRPVLVSMILSRGWSKMFATRLPAAIAQRS